MKLNAKERLFVEVLRQLDTRQGEKYLDSMKRQVLANQITKRVGKLRKLTIVDDRKIEKAFGAPDPKKRPGRRGNDSRK